MREALASIFSTPKLNIQKPGIILLLREKHKFYESEESLGNTTSYRKNNKNYTWRRTLNHSQTRLRKGMLEHLEDFGIKEAIGTA